MNIEANIKILQEQAIVAENMERYGGSFIQNIGRALLHADFHNAKKIHDTWCNEWKTYFGFTQLKRGKDA